MTSGQTANVFDFGATGDGVTDDTAAIQAAINYCVANTNSGSSTTPAKGPITLTFPPGYYKVSAPLTVTGTIAIAGQANAEFSSGTRIFQTTSNDLFFVKPSVTNPTFSIENVTLLSTIAGTGHLINFQPTGTTYFNSNRITNCCFSNPQQASIRLCGDDVKIQGCTFDVSGYSGLAIELGSNTSGDSVTNSSITECNFFNIPVRCISVYNASSIRIENNVVSQNGSSKTIAFVDGLDTSATQFYAISTSSNTLTGVSRMFAGSAATNCVFSNNIAYDCGLDSSETRNAIEFINVSQNISIDGNLLNGAYGSYSIFKNTGTLSNISFTDNIVSGSSSGTAVVCGAMTGNVSNNSISGWSTSISSSNFANIQYNFIGIQAPTYGSSVNINAVLGDTVLIEATNGSSFTINAPTNPYAGRKLTIVVLNNSGGSLGTITWNAIYKMNAFSNPANQYLQSITFDYISNLGYWYEINRTSTQIPL